MSGFLDGMARSSAERVAQAMRLESAADLRARARRAPSSPPLRLSRAGFDVIAELKLRSPAAGLLGEESHDWLGRVVDYARGGARRGVRSDRTLPFRRIARAPGEGSRGLGAAAGAGDAQGFLVDSYQVLEARAAGAGGVLAILRMLPRERIVDLLDVAAEHGMFVLLEAFDGDDLRLARELTAARSGREEVILVGINSRDLQTLKVVPERFADLAPQLPDGRPAVAESGVASAADAARMMRLGYRLALIGTALMSREDPAQLLREIFAATRTVQA